MCRFVVVVVVAAVVVILMKEIIDIQRPSRSRWIEREDPMPFYGLADGDVSIYYR